MGFAKNGIVKFFERNRCAFVHNTFYRVLFFECCRFSRVHVFVLNALHYYRGYFAGIFNSNKKISFYFQNKPCYKKISEKNFCNAVPYFWRYYYYNGWANCRWNDHCKLAGTYSHSNLQPRIVHSKSYSNSPAKHSIYFNWRACTFMEREKFSGDKTYLSTFVH